MMTGVLPFYVEEVLERDKPGVMVAVLTGSAIAVVVVVLPFVVLLARRRSKRESYGWGMLFASLYFPLFFFAGFVPAVPAGGQAVAFALLLGLALAPVQTFPNALIAVITDYDHLRTGERREATYYATLEKTASAAATGLLVALLAIGSTTADPLGIRLVGPVSGALALVGYLVFRRYWLPDAVTAASVAEAR